MISALVIGFFGSLHCLGMCGPLMITFIGPSRKASTVLYYHAGRIVAYGAIGLFLGLIGESVAFFSIQKYVTLLMGFFLIILYGVPKVRGRVERWYYNSRFSGFIRKELSKNVSSGKRWFLSGLANGFLPCGLTYIAAAGAVALGNYANGVLFMVLFGLGTLPALLGLQISSIFTLSRVKRFLPRVTAIIAILSGAILMLRGALMTFPSFNQMVQANAMSLIHVCGF